MTGWAEALQTAYANGTLQVFGANGVQLTVTPEVLKRIGPTDIFLEGMTDEKGNAVLGVVITQKLGTKEAVDLADTQLQQVPDNFLPDWLKSSTADKVTSITSLVQGVEDLTAAGEELGAQQGKSVVLDQLMSLNSDDLSKISGSIAAAMAALASGTLDADTEAKVQEQLNSLLTVIRTADEYLGVGNDISAGIAGGMTTYGWTGDATTVASSIETALRAAAQTHSPSAMTRPIGIDFICLWKCDQQYMYACDPASATRKRQKLSDFKRQVKRYFIFWPPADLGASDDVPAITEPVSVEPVSVEPALPTVKVTNGIYDISKWQGKINWAKVAASGLVKLVIIRAGYGQETVDPRFVENVEGVIRYGIPYAVYWYSYTKATGTESAVRRAQNEADSFYRVTSKYSPRFWLLDAEEACLTGDSINAFLVRIRALSDGKVGAYIANHRFASYKVDTSLADFVMIPRGNRIQPTHRPLDLWQYSFSSRVPGIGGNVDQSKIPECGRYPLEWFLAAPERSVADVSG